MKKIYYLLLLSIFVATGQRVSAQFVDVTATSGTLTGSYATLKDAFDAINLGTHKGDIVIDINSSITESAPAVLNSGDADPASYSSILIEPVADGVVVSGAPGAGRGVIELNGADNVFIIGDNPNSPGNNRDLTISNTSAATLVSSSVIRLATHATGALNTDNNFILNCILSGNVTGGNASAITSTTSSANLSFGIYCGGNAGATNTTAPTAISTTTPEAAPAGTKIDNLVIDNNEIIQCGRGIEFNGAASSVSGSLTITNNVIGASGVPGSYPFTTPSSTVYTKGIWIAGTDAVYINGNTIQNIISYVATTISGVEIASAIGTNLVEVSDNTITGVANNGTSDANAVLVSAASAGFNITGNTITTVFGSPALPVSGVKIATAGGAATVNRNKISNVYNKNTGGYGALGVYFATAANGGEIRNNFIFDIMNIGNSSFANTAENTSGILLASGANHKIYHNSVHLSGASPATNTNVITCFSVASSAVTGLDIRNNIFSNTVTGGSGSDAHVCMYFPFAASATLGYNINNNAYYTGSVVNKSGLAFAGASAYSTANLFTAGNFNALSTAPATNFRSYSSAAGISASDFASFATTAAAPFVSATDLHIPAATTTSLESGGAAVGVSIDIDNAARSAGSPDIGADEFAGTPQDLTPPSIVFTPLTGACDLLARTLTATITDPSGVGSGANLPRLFWKINAGVYTAAAAPTVAGNNYTFTFGAGVSLGDVVSYYIVAQDNASTPNVISESSIGAGGFTANPPTAGTAPTTVNTYTVQSSLAPGTYNVGAGQTYTTLTAAVNAYNTSCLSGAVVFNLVDATYPSETFPIVIANPVASSVNTLTIKPNTTASITGASSVALIKLNGADYVTIDGSNSGGSDQSLTLTNTDAGTSSAVIWLASASTTNGATHNTIKNCAIVGNGTTTTFGGIISSGSTVGGVAEAANSSNTYQNNNISKSYYGLITVGPSAGETGTVINSNKVGSSVATDKLGFIAVFVSNQTGVTVSNNTILGVTSTVGSNTSVTGGITIRGAISGGNIFNNVIHDIKNTNTAAWTAHGITLQSSSTTSGLKVYNNFIYDITGDGYTPNVTDNGHGIGILGGGGYNIYYNSINLNTDQPTAGNSAAIFIDNRTSAGVTPVNLDIRNNIFSNPQTAASGGRYSIYSAVPASSFTNIDYNDYYSTGVLGYLGSSRGTIAAWQTATGQDLNSVAVNPVFVSPTNLHLQSTLPSSPLDALATPIAGITTDIDGNPRNASTPDMGADEFTPANCVSNSGGTISASSTQICVSGAVSLTGSGYATGLGIAYQWESSTDNVTYTDIAGETSPANATPPSISATTYYRLRVTCAAGSPGYSNIVTVTVSNPSLLGTTGGSRCGVGTVSLSATGSVGSSIKWYAAATGGTALYTGSPFTTPVISGTTTYYAEAAVGGVSGSVGPASPTAQGGTIGTQTVSWEVNFDVLQATTLVSIDVFPLASGQSSTLIVYNSAGTALATIPYTTTVSGGSTPQTIPINVALPIGTDYYLYAPGGLPSSGLTRNTSNGSYPYTSTAINITGNGFTDTYFMGYYNWQFSSICGSARTAVTATVTPPPTLTTLTASPSTVCVGTPSTLTASGATFTSYSWTPGSLSGSSVSVTPSATTTYTVTASAPGGCVNTGQITVNVNPTPQPVVISPASATVCVGSTQTITATGGSGTFFEERFESFPISKFVVTGTGMTENQDLTYFQEGSSAVRLSYQNNITDADAASYETTNNIDLSIYTNPVLTFYHIAAIENNGSSNWDFGYVEYSTDGGSNWTPFPVSSWTNTGATLRNGVVCFEKTSYADWNSQLTDGTSTPTTGPSLWKLETLNLSAWQSSTQFKFRFRIKSDGSVLYYGWMLDKIQVSGQASVTWSPVTELYTNAGATIAYTAGTNYPVVYAKPSATRDYIATASFGTCSVKDTITTTVTSNPISIVIAASPSTTICGGDTAHITITSQNVQGSSSPVYDWKKNGVTITAGPISATSSGTTVTVASTAGFYQGMAISGGTLAPGSKISGIISPTQFSVDITPISPLTGQNVTATANSTIVTDLYYGGLANGDVVTCTLTVGGPGTATCIPVNPLTSNALTFNVSATTPTSVSIAASPGSTICASQSVTFTATPVNGGAAPTYEWFINGISQGAPAASNTFTTTTLTNGQSVTCRMFSNALNCPLPKVPYSSAITMTVNPSFPVSVSIAASPGVNVCTGTNVTFTATPTNGGLSPTYEWFVNGFSQGAPSGVATFSRSTLNDLDMVTCVLTSSISSCALGNPATSNPLTMNITVQTASVVITPTAAVCAGTLKTFTAVATNGGVSPTYEFFVNGSSVQGPGATDAYSYTPVDGDNIRVDMVSSLSCATPKPATITIVQTVNANPTASITGSNLLCSGIPVLLNSNAAAGSGTITSIQWRLGGVNIGGATSSTYAATAVGNYDVVVSNSNGCSVTTSPVFTITAAPTLMAGVYTIGAVTATANGASAGTTINVASTANLVVGAAVTKVSGTGVFAANTVITSIVSGTQFTVNNTPTTAFAAGATIAGSTCSNYISFATAISDLNSRSISGNCTFNVTPGYVENITTQLALGNATLNAAVAGKTIVFQKSGVGVNPLINAAFTGVANPNSPNPDGIWSLNGIDNVTIDGIDINDNNSTNQLVCMEFGYGLFKLNNTDGAQNNLIKNCTITLNRINAGAGSSLTANTPGSNGIVVFNSIRTNATVALAAGGAAGANSYNKFYSNTIQNCNAGIALVGLAAVTPFTDGDFGNDIGGSSAATGNNIINFGGGAAAVQAAAGVIASNQWDINISYNTINNNTGAGVNHPAVIRGIWAQAGTSASATINNNNLSIYGGGTTSAITVIDNAIGSTAASNTVAINNNTITGSYTTATSGAWSGILNSATPATLNMNGNTVQNVTQTGTGTFIAIGNSAVLPGVVTVNSNMITGNTKQGTGTVSLISLPSPAATATVSINSNSITNNTVTGGGAAVTLNCITQTGSSTYTVNSNTISNNSITGMTGTAVGTIYGYVNNGGAQDETLTSNVISDLFITGTSTGSHVLKGIHNNTSASSTRTVSGNTISNLYSNSGSSIQITGIHSQLGGTVLITKNKVFNLFPGQGSSTNTFAKGIAMPSGTNVTVVNNMISIDLTLAAASTASVAANSVLTVPDGLRGIEASGTVANSTFNIYYNSIRLAGNGGTGFGSTGFYHTTSATATTGALNLRNNLVDNECVPNGGLTVAYRRSNATLTNYAGTSNNNLFYAGTPSASRLIFYDGTNSDQTLAAYKTRMSTRDAASVSDQPNFTGTNDLHLTTNNNCTMNGQGAPISGFTDDFDTDTRDASTPDIGFDEFAGTNPVSLTVTNPAAVCTGNTVDITAVTTGSTGGSVFYYYSDAAGTIPVATPSAINVSGTYYIKYGFGNCYSPITPVVVVINPNNTWLGINTDWNDAQNWCPGVPTSATNVTIPTAANYPNISTTAVANNISITGSGTITVAAGGKLGIYGTLTSTVGAIDATAGTVEFAGAAAQTLRANYFSTSTISTLLVSNTSAGGLTIDNTGNMLNITNEVNFGNASNQKLNTSNLLTLKSTATATARIADVTLNSTRTGNDVVGKVVVERYIPAHRAWRLLTAPVKSSTSPTPTIFNNWQESARSYPLGTLADPVPGFGTHISYGNNVPNFDQNNTNNASIFYLTTTGWNGVPTNTSGTTIGGNNGVITDQPGYMVFVRGDRSTNLSLGQYAPTSPTTLRTTGDLNVTSNAASPMTITGKGALVSGPSTYYAMANPYASSISYEKIYTDPLNTGIPSSYYIWDANLTGSSGVGAWVTVTRGSGGIYSSSPNIASLNTGEIQSGMAFLVNSPSIIPSFSIKESFKVSGSNVLMYRPSNSQVRTTLIADNADGSASVNDGTLITFNTEYNNDLDKEDATKLPTFAENISMVKNGVDMSIEKRSSISATDTIFFRLSRMKTKHYKLEFELGGLTGVEGNSAVLEDLFLGSKTALNMEGSSSYAFDVATGTASADANRFRIVFNKLVQFTNVDAQLQNTDVAVNWNVSGEFNIDHYEVERSTDGSRFETIGSQLSAGDAASSRQYSLLDLNPLPGVYYYRIKCYGSTGAIAYSNQAKVTVIKGSPAMFVFPNPVTNNTIGLQMNKMPGGVYEVVLMTQDGKVVDRNRVVHAAGTATETIKPKATLISGAYQLKVIGPDHSSNVIGVIVQAK